MYFEEEINEIMRMSCSPEEMTKNRLEVKKYLFEHEESAWQAYRKKLPNVASNKIKENKLYEEELRMNFGYMFFDLIEYTMRTYDPSKNDSFGAFFNSILNLRQRRVIEKNFDDNKVVSYDRTINDDEGNTTSVYEASGELGYTDELPSDSVILLMVNILMVKEKTTDQSSLTETKKLLCYAVFYTGQLIGHIPYVSDNILTAYHNSKVIFAKTDKGFVFYMTEKNCSCIYELRDAKLKYSLPVTDTTYLGYLKTREQKVGRTIFKDAVEEFRKSVSEGFYDSI